MPEFVGKYCQQLNLSTEVLLLNSQSIPQVQPSKITNGLINELVKFHKIRRLPWKAAISWLTQLYGRKWPIKNPPAELTLIKTLTTVNQKHRSLVLKRNSVNLNKFCESQFLLPQSVCIKDNECYAPPTQQDHAKRRSILRKEEFQAYKILFKDLTKDLQAAKSEAELIQKRYHSLRKEVNRRNLHKREKRKMLNIKEKKKLIRTLVSENKKLADTLQRFQRRYEKHEAKNTEKLRKCREKIKKTKARYKVKYYRLQRRLKPCKTFTDSEASLSEEESDSLS